MDSAQYNMVRALISFRTRLDERANTMSVKVKDEKLKEGNFDVHRASIKEYITMYLEKFPEHKNNLDVYQATVNQKIWHPKPQS